MDTYRAAGFQRISTPILEDMENLDKSDGGDNLNLIFKGSQSAAKSWPLPCAPAMKSSFPIWACAMT